MKQTAKTWEARYRSGETGWDRGGAGEMLSVVDRGDIQTITRRAKALLVEALDSLA